MLSLILIFFLSGPSDQPDSFAACFLASLVRSNACSSREPHRNRTKIVLDGPRMSYPAQWQDVHQENYGKLYINFHFAIKPGFARQALNHRLASAVF
jgi:hypothetical protein